MFLCQVPTRPPPLLSVRTSKQIIALVRSNAHAVFPSRPLHTFCRLAPQNYSVETTTLFSHTSWSNSSSLRLYTTTTKSISALGRTSLIFLRNNSQSRQFTSGANLNFFQTSLQSSRTHSNQIISDVDTTKCVFFFDIDNCLYSKNTGIPGMMKARIEKYFRDSGIPHDEVEDLAYRYYIDYGLAIRGLVEKHPEINISDYDSKVDGDLPLENILTENHLLREMIQSMNVGKKWLFTNAGENHANRVVEILGLQGLFDGTTFCNYLEHQFVCKPDRKAFEKAMKQAGVQDSSLCYFVDDSAPNVDMALKLGWTAVHLNEDDHHHYYPQQTPNTETLTPARLEIKSIFDLPKTFPQFWNKK